MQDLVSGDMVPDFQVKDIFDQPIQMSNYVGKRTLLVFFRFASCPLCTVRFNQLVQNYHAYEAKDLNIIAVFESSADYIKRYATNKKNVPFPVIADLEGELYELYNVKKSVVKTFLGMFRIVKMFQGMIARRFSMAKPDGSITRVPADFLIGPLLSVKESYYGKDIGDHIPLNKIDEFAGIKESKSKESAYNNSQTEMVK